MKVPDNVSRSQLTEAIDEWVVGTNAERNRRLLKRRYIDGVRLEPHLQSQTRDILGAVTNGTAQTIAASTANATNAINAIKDGNASLIREFGTVETALTALSGKQQECCCDIKQLVQATAYETNAQIAQNKYEAAMRDAATNANFTAQIQGVKDMIAQNKIEAQAQRINQLELAQATAGMLRFPNSWSYGAGPFPPIFGGCCNNV